jgi:predicted ATP-grasp superfamily ATP-dependent carboligase
MRILIVGLSTRAIAESAVRGDHPIVTLDYFGDRDQRALVENYALQRDFDLPFSAEALLQASRHLDFEAIVYISNLENHPEVVEELARTATLLGNAPAVLQRVRDWRMLPAFCREQGIPFPSTFLPGEEKDADPSARLTCPGGRCQGSSPKSIRWLRKPVRSGGGHGITFWRDDQSVGRGFMLQEYVPGLACSASFVANGRECVVIGLAEQFIGRSEFGARGFHYCGNLLPLDAARDPVAGRAILDQVQRIATSLTREFSLVGVNGVDFVLTNGQVCLIEVNPRYSASMELVERAYGLSVFDLHVKAMLHGELPAFDLATQLAGGPFHAKVILYAEKDAVAPDTGRWLERGIRDVPYPGESLARGGPVCTILACEPTRDACFAAAVAQVGALKGEIYA